MTGGNTTGTGVDPRILRSDLLDRFEEASELVRQLAGDASGRGDAALAIDAANLPRDLQDRLHRARLIRNRAAHTSGGGLPAAFEMEEVIASLEADLPLLHGLLAVRGVAAPTDLEASAKEGRQRRREQDVILRKARRLQKEIDTTIAEMPLPMRALVHASMSKPAPLVETWRTSRWMQVLAWLPSIAMLVNAGAMVLQAGRHPDVLPAAATEAAMAIAALVGLRLSGRGGLRVMAWLSVLLGAGIGWSAGRHLPGNVVPLSFLLAINPFSWTGLLASDRDYLNHERARQAREQVGRGNP